MPNYPFILYTLFETKLRMRNRHYLGTVHENNNNVKPARHKIREGIICLVSLPFLKYLFSAAVLSIKEMLSLSIGTMISQ